jgi:four helix bundle protein
VSDEGRVASGEVPLRRPVRGYRDLLVWQRAMDLLVAVYGLTRQLPRTEAFGLTGQLQRAVVSIPGNIAEGQGRLHRGDFVHHLSIARGSLLEVETYLVAIVRLGFLPSREVDPVIAACEEVSRLLAGLLKSLGELRLHRRGRDNR